MALVGIIAVSVFFIGVRGAEQTMVPDVQGRDLTAALLELQVKELYPRITLRFSQSSADRGLIMEQSPRPGTIVKAGRRVNLVVSQGVMINTVENYLGRNLDEVRMGLQTTVSAMAALTGGGMGAQLISLREPIMYEFSNEPAGTILQQSPEPGTPISSLTVLELVVSQGSENIIFNLPVLLGLSLEDALEQVGRTGIDFEFSLREARDWEVPGTVVSQEPAGDSLVTANTRVHITVASPQTLSANEVFGLFEYEMARNPYPLSIRLESIQPTGERQRLLSVQYAGGRLAVPYRQAPGSVLVLYMLNREISRQTVTHAGGSR